MPKYVSAAFRAKAKARVIEIGLEAPLDQGLALRTACLLQCKATDNKWCVCGQYQSAEYDGHAVYKRCCTLRHDTSFCRRRQSIQYQKVIC